MKKQTKVIVGAGVLAAIVAFIALRPKKTMSGTSIVLNTENNNTAAGIKCSEGQVPCPNNNGKCYDKSINYLIDPCTGRTAELLTK